MEINGKDLQQALNKYSSMGRVMGKRDDAMKTLVPYLLETIVDKLDDKNGAVDNLELDKLKIDLEGLSKKVEAQAKELQVSKDEVAKLKKDLSVEKAKVTKLQNANK